MTPTNGDAFDASVDAMRATIQRENVSVQEVQEALIAMLTAAETSTSAQMTAALAQIAETMAPLDLTRAAFLAVGSGALIERGASPAPIAAVIVAKARAALESPATDDSSRQTVLDMLATAALAVAMRDPALRHELSHDAALIAACEQHQATSSAVECLLDLFKVLDDETILVFHPASGKGYRIIISGIGKNFELHTLLDDAVYGEPADGRIAGDRPNPLVVAAAKDGPFPQGEDADDDFPHALSYTNLWNWTGLRPDGTLPSEQREVLALSDHFIWNEGIPADIVPFEGQRIILLSEVNFSRGWNAGRYFPGMHGDLRVMETFEAPTVQAWLRKLAQAPR